jgi:simple sugar transport system permease protein
MKRPWVFTCFAVAGSVIAFGGVVRLAGKDPFEVIKTFATSGIKSPFALAETVVKAIPILFCAIAAAIPGRLGLTNIGGEGQLVLGAIGTTWAANMLPPSIPPFLTLVTMALVAAACGATWGLIPGMLRALIRSNEIVITLLMNYVAGLLLLHLIHGPWKDPGSLGWPQSAPLPDHARMLGIGGTRIHGLLVVGLLACAALAFAARATVAGMASRIIRANPATARYVGLPVGWYYVVAFALGGVAAALAGLGEVAAIQGRLRDGISLGYGYAGFFVAWLCRNRFGWLPLGAFFFALIITGADSLQISAGLPFATVYLLQGLGFLAVLAAESFTRNAKSQSTVQGGGQ